MKNSSLLAVIGASSLLLANATTAQEPTEIVITAKGQQTLADVAATSHVITAKEIEKSQAKDVTELLNTISGISVRDSGTRGSASGVFVRGTTSSQIVVLVDGIRSGSPTLGSTEMSHIPVEAIERIEVVKGPLSGLYGADAIGGVIQIFTKKGGGSNSLALTAGSNGFKKGVVSVGAGNEKNNFRLTASTEETDGIDSTSILTEGNGDDDGFEADNINISGAFSVSEGTNVRVSHLQTENEVEFDNTFGSDDGRFSENAIQNTSVAVNSALSDSLQWNTVVGKQTDESETLAFSSSIIGERVSFTSQVEKQYGANNVFTFGVDAYDEDIESSNDFPVTDRENKGAFTQLQQNFGAIGVVANVRVDDSSAYGDNTNGSLAINSQLNNQTRFTVSYGTAFRAPTFNDLYFPGFGNTEIQPEESESLEISLRGSTSTAQWRVSAFNTDVTNLIGFDSETFMAANTADASLKGFEFEISTRLGGWLLAANLDLLSAEDDSTGEKLDDRVEQTINLSASKSFGAFSTRIDVLTEDGRHDQSGTEVDGFVKVDLSGSYDISENFALSAKVNNLFDKDYTVNLINETESYNTEGRTFKVTGKYSF